MFRLHQMCIFLRNSNGSSISEAFLKSLCSFPASIRQYPFSSSSSSSSTVDFFVNNLGVPPDSALAAANTIRGKPTAKSDAVLALLAHYGFSSAQIADIFTRRPCLLLYDPEKNLQPKLEFLSRNGISGEALVTVVSTNPTIFERSLNKKIKPCIELLNSFYGNSGDVVSFFSAKWGPRFLQTFSERMGPNIDTLRSYGVANAGIQTMMKVRPRALSWIPDEFSELVEETRKMGFEPSSLMFIHGVCTLSGMKKDKWVAKVEVFKSFGWSEEEVRSLFVKQPVVMLSSKEHLKKSLDFFMNKLGWSKLYISKYPTVLHLSFEKRLVPRSTVLQHLISKGHLDKKNMGRAFLWPENKFMKKYVMDYLEHVPQLLDMYQNKMPVL